LRFGKAAAVLVVMHHAIALVTYNALVHLAPIRALRHTSQWRVQPVHG